MTVSLDEEIAITHNQGQALSKKLRTVRAREQRLRRENQKLRKTIEAKDKNIKKWKMRYYRLKNKRPDEQPLVKRVQEIEKQGPKAVRQQLLFAEAFKEQLKIKAKEMKTETEKRVFSQIVSGKVIKKYKQGKNLSSFISVYRQRKYCDSESLIFTRSREKHSSFMDKHKESVREFLERDENSAPAPGIKDCVRRKKVYYRKRYLLDTLKNLYAKYSAEKIKEGQMKVSWGLFCRLRPFWVVQKRETGRDTCLCKLHSNFDLIVKSLKSRDLLKSANKNDIVSEVVCDQTKKPCMYRQCDVCKNKQVSVVGNSDVITYEQWVTEKVVRPGAKGKMYEVKLTFKKKIISTTQDLVAKFNSQLPVYMQHVYDTSHQFMFLKELQKNLKENEVMIVMDFSENYKCKYASEIQSVHFGASKKQVSLHTGAYYYRTKSGEVECVSFCSVSECLRHDASAVWAHLQPVLAEITKKLTHVDVLHFQSDGPSTQYKNKSNFYLLSHYCEKFQMRLASYTFTTPGHGKSTADGTGGTVKCTCDRAVLQGTDVLSAEDMIAVLKKAQSKIQMFLIIEQDIEKVDKVLKNLVPIPQTKKIFQLRWTKKQKNRIFTNSLACLTCLYQPECTHYGLNKTGFLFKEAIEKINKNSKKSVQLAQSEAKITKKTTEIATSSSSQRSRAQPKKHTVQKKTITPKDKGTVESAAKKYIPRTSSRRKRAKN